jgi:hypothetical protein
MRKKPTAARNGNLHIQIKCCIYSNGYAKFSIDPYGPENRPIIEFNMFFHILKNDTSTSPLGSPSLQSDSTTTTYAYYLLHIFHASDELS